VARIGDMACGWQVVYGYITYMLAAAPGDVGPLSSLHVSDRRGWWWPRLAVKTTAEW